MQTKIIEVENGFNWGKFLLMRFDAEWAYRSAVDALPLLATRGWCPEHLWVMDLQTGEGACFRPGGLASGDLNSHAIWVCPMFEPFLEWLYKQDLSDLGKLPQLVSFTPEETRQHTSLKGYRRPGRVMPSGQNPMESTHG